MPTELPSGPVKYELDNGRIVQMSPPANQHGRTQAIICGELRSQGELRGHGQAYGEVGVILWRDPDRVVGIDSGFVKTESLPVSLSPEGYLEKVPDLVVEIRSKNDRPKYVTRKVGDYVTAGVKAVLVIDPQARTATAHRPNAEPQVFHEQDILTLDGIIPGFRLPVADLF
jgi:Uma2 family endonuclease